MRAKEKLQIAKNNLTLDKFLKPRCASQASLQSRTPNQIKVPPSSGLFPLTVPSKPVLRYPSRPEFREYQQEIVSTCICNNTLVCLPTGLGKTHIAAVVMANFSRWFPEHKIVFLAPTRPLVRQQIFALQNLQDQVAEEQVVQVNGQLPAHKREQLYSSHQVIFATPQTIENDLQSGRLDGKRIVLLVFDECHRAVGNSSYRQIMRQMNCLEVGFRVVGLSATPGSEPEKIQEVISNLNIKKVLYKDEEDPEVKKYLHQKTIHQIKIPQNSIIQQSLACLEKFAAPSLALLTKLQLVQPWIVRKGLSGTSFFLIRERFGEKIGDATSNVKALAYAALKILGFLFRCRKSLNDQGYQTFKSQFFSEVEPPKPASLPKPNNDNKETAEDEENGEIEISLTNIYDYYPQNSATNSRVQGRGSSLPTNFKKGLLESKQYKRLYEIFHRGASNYMHPKLVKLAQILSSFFAEKPGKAMVFTQLRMSAKEIKEYLCGVQGVKSELFFGQSKTVGENEETGESFCLQLRQKQQLEVIEKYKRGQINTLISTSIGEQGLDIGEVDCIICYDGGHSPIRAIQRRGRTGRKRAGEVYILLMEGKESADYEKGCKKEGKMKDILRKQCQKFTYFPFNSSLFQENTIIPIELYQNELARNSAKKTKLKIVPRQASAKKTKKIKGGNVTSANQESHQSCSDFEDVEVSITTISNLLVKYKQDEESEEETNCIDCPLVNQHAAEQSMPSVAQPMQQSDDDEDIMMEYLRERREREQAKTITQQSDSMSSDEIVSILESLQRQRELPSLP